MQSLQLVAELVGKVSFQGDVAICSLSKSDISDTEGKLYAMKQLSLVGAAVFLFSLPSRIESVPPIVGQAVGFSIFDFF